LGTIPRQRRQVSRRPRQFLTERRFVLILSA
jgi:hypothetical protein